MTSSPDTSGILVCAGNATRMQGQNKILLPLGQTNVIGMSMLAMEHCDRIAEFIVVARPSDHDAIQKTIAGLQLKKCSAIVPGGATRQESVLNGVRAASKETKLFAIHDGARPLVNGEIIERAVDGAREFSACVASMPVKDTIKAADAEGFSASTPDRSTLWQIQTPQAFRFGLIYRAYEKVFAPGTDRSRITDDAMVVELMTDTKVKFIEGSYSNIKVTTPEDMIIAEALCAHRVQ